MLEINSEKPPASIFRWEEGDRLLLNVDYKIHGVTFWRIALLITQRYSLKPINSVVLVCEGTIPTEQPPLAREVSAKRLRIEGFG
jgi:hypothetical protein